ncbi:MAG: sodium:proton antiporter, partial [Lachnospiraceae bacterium]|nr:sodium:proton antiporter [Lachnospiraceae bacterium]
MNILIYSIIFLPMAAALIGYIIGRFQKEARSYFADIVTGVIFICTLYLFLQIQTQNTPEILFEIPYVCGMGLHFTLDGFRALYCMVAAFMWFMSTLFSKEYLAHYRNRNRYYLFLLLTMGSTEGVVLSAVFV